MPDYFSTIKEIEEFFSLNKSYDKSYSSLFFTMNGRSEEIKPEDREKFKKCNFINNTKEDFNFYTKANRYGCNILGIILNKEKLEQNETFFSLIEKTRDSIESNTSIREAIKQNITIPCSIKLLKLIEEKKTDKNVFLS